MTRPGPRSLYNGLVCSIASFVWPTQFFKCKWKALSITVLLLCEKLAGAEASLQEKSQKKGVGEGVGVFQHVSVQDYAKCLESRGV